MIFTLFSKCQLIRNLSFGRKRNYVYDWGSTYIFHKKPALVKISLLALLICVIFSIHVFGYICKRKLDL